MYQAQLTLTAYISGLGLGQIIVGPLSDALGRKKPLVVGVVAFALTSLLCAFAPSGLTLSLLRFGQGLAGAAGIAIALAIASDLYKGTALARCLSSLMLVNAVAPIIAPVLGGQLLAFTSWRGIFVTLALFAIAMLWAVAFGVAETLPSTKRQKGGLATAFGVMRQELINLRFVSYAFTTGFAFAAGIVYISVSPFILQNLYRLTPQSYSLLFGLNALGLAVMAQVGSRLVGKVSGQKLLGWGVATMVLGGIGLLIAVFCGVSLPGIIIALFLVVASLGLIAPNATALALSHTKAAGTASALLGVLQLLIGAVAAPLVGLGGTTSALPMAGAIAAFSLATLFSFLITCYPLQSSDLNLSDCVG
jgi:DHA1 family bicyclomycin/chloramphenicol resistance-like MFS transporter